MQASSGLGGSFEQSALRQPRGRTAAGACPPGSRIRETAAWPPESRFGYACSSPTAIHRCKHPAQAHNRGRSHLRSSTEPLIGRVPHGPHGPVQNLASRQHGGPSRRRYPKVSVVQLWRYALPPLDLAQGDTLLGRDRAGDIRVFRLSSGEGIRVPRGGCERVRCGCGRVSRDRIDAVARPGGAVGVWEDESSPDGS